MNLFFAILLLVLALVGVVLRKTYYALPPHELKRRAAQHEPAAQKIYRAVAYGNSLHGLLWLYIGLTAAGGVVILSRSLSVWLSLLIIAAVLWVAFSLVPGSRSGRAGNYLTQVATPAVTWVLNYLHRPLSRVAELVEGRYTSTNHTGLYERADLVRLLKQQHAQADNRLTDKELEMAIRALSFDEHSVADILTPANKLATVLADDTVGPVLIDELHKTGQAYALVRQSAKGDVVGSLRFDKLDLNSHGHVRDIMNTDVYFLNEKDSLSEVLQAFFVTGQTVFVVINKGSDFLGAVSVQNALRELLGAAEQASFDQYADPEAVAARHNQPAEVEAPEAEIIEEGAGEPVAETVEEESPEPSLDAEPEVNESSESAETPVKTDYEVIE